MADQKKEEQRVTLFLDPSLVQKARILAVKNNVSLSKIVDFALAREVLERELEKYFKDK